MKPFAMIAACLTLALLLRPAVAASAGAFVDPLDTPAQVSPLASKTLLQAVARAGTRLVAVGQRGHIVVSTDNGATWTQAKVPVSSDLTAVYFVNERKGWAVGHDGVVLVTADGGDTWTLQLDGPRANERLVEHLQKRVTETPNSAELKQLLDDAKRYKEQGADKPFLDVWFADENTGYVVGAYNLIFRTGDGGKNWQPWFDRTDNPKLLNLYAIRAGGGRTLHRRRGRAGAQARRRRAALPRAGGTVQGQLLRRDRRQGHGGAVRAARQRLSQRGRWHAPGSRRRRDWPPPWAAPHARPRARSCLADVSGRVVASATADAPGTRSRCPPPPPSPASPTSATGASRSWARAAPPSPSSRCADARASRTTSWR